MVRTDMSENLSALRRVGDHVNSVITFQPQNAPGVYITAGLVGETTCASADIDRQKSWIRCMGEAAEFMGQERPAAANIVSDKDKSSWPDFFMKEVERLSHTNHCGLEGVDYSNGNPVILPEIFCRGNSQASKIVMSSGCAAGSNPSNAILSGLLEVIEHYVAYKWWHSRKIDDQPNFYLAQFSQVKKLISKIRLNNDHRQTYVVLLNNFYGVYVSAAWSFNKETNDGFVCATAADTNLIRSAKSALFELIQLEWGYENTANNINKKLKVPTKEELDMLRLSKSITKNDQRLNYCDDDFNRILSSTKHTNELSFPEIIKALNKDNICAYGVLLHSEPGLAVVKSFIDLMILKRPIFS